MAKMKRATTADGRIVWINTEAVVAVYRCPEFDKVDICTVKLVDGDEVLLPGTPDEVMMTVIGT